MIGACLAPAIPAHADEAPSEARKRLNQQFNKAIHSLIEASQNETQREHRRKALLPTDPSRLYLFIPPGDDSNQPAVDDAALARVQQIFGEKIFQLAVRSIQADEAGQAYRWLHEVLRYIPDHKEATRLLNMPKNRAARIRPGQRTHPKYGWKTGSYLQIDTPNFRITTNRGEAAGKKLADTLEELNSAWRQLFFDYWSRPAALKVALTGRPLTLRSKAKHQVVLFRDRIQYTEFVKAIEPNAQMTLGYYHAPSRTAFFFGDESNQSTWRHEATHQLFQEKKRTPSRVGETAHFWVVEGIALYMESLKNSNNLASLGGIESDRLQFARYRFLRESFYVPFDRFAALGRIDLQQDPQIRKLYSQAAGLTHFFMNGKDDQRRSAFIDYITSVYAPETKANALAKLVDDNPSQIDQQYHDFLNVDDSDLLMLDPSVRLHNLAFGSTHITDRGLQAVERLEKLVWLDLKGTKISDLGTTHLPTAESLIQLSLEQTQIGNETVARLAPALQLEDLDLSHTNINDDALSMIAKFPNLKILWLTGTEVSDEGIRHLHNHANLREVDLSGTKVTPAGQQQLQEMLQNKSE